ncbi:MULTISPECIES: DciA family protein [Chitinibacter]|uniref:DciA family protein n=1 Tax=Chitinibacter TaxID=230666 RepID=UPI00068FAC0E|nr:MULTISPECIES: DciA family protein [Chitinibacter]
MNKQVHVSQLMEGDFQLKRLVRQLDQYQQLLQIVRSALSPEVARVCQGVAWSGSTLLVAVPGSAAAARLRQSEPDILAALDRAGVHATAIRAKVQVALQQGNPMQTKTLRMTEPAKAAFSALAEEVSDPDLKQALSNLLRHHRR